MHKKCDFILQRSLFFGLPDEKNTSKLFKEYFDYSSIFIESLNDMYNQVCKFAGIFFEELFIIVFNFIKFSS